METEKTFTFDQVDCEDWKLVRIWLDDTPKYYFLRNQLQKLFEYYGVKKQTFSSKASKFKAPVLTEKQKDTIKVTIDPTPSLGQGFLLHYEAAQRLVEHFFSRFEQKSKREELNAILDNASPNIQAFDTYMEEIISTKKQVEALTARTHLLSPSLPFDQFEKEKEILAYLVEISDLEPEEQEKLFNQKFPKENFKDWDGQDLDEETNSSSLASTDSETWEIYKELEGSETETYHASDWDNNCNCDHCKSARIYSLISTPK